jgi:alpha,alpha-trehalase
MINIHPHRRTAPATVLTLALTLLLTACASAPATGPGAPPAQASASTQRLSPDQAYPELFQAVQQGELFEDQKQFVDAVPRREPALIGRDYLAMRPRADFDLRRFVADNFEPPEAAAADAPSGTASLVEHIDALWPVLTRHYPRTPEHGSLLPLPHPYVVPGGRFRELYYWDSYFTLLGLAQSGRQPMVRHMLDNFAHLIDRHGHVPNANRSYYLSRSQPPFFSHMVALQAQSGDAGAYLRYLPQLQREHGFWMDGAATLRPGEATRRVVRLDDGSVLNRYWDARGTPRPESWRQDRETAAQAPQRAPTDVYRDLRAGAESGWDYSSRWLGDRRRLASIRTTAIVPVDLNSLLYHLETTLATACALPAAAPCAQDYRALADKRREAIEKHLWNDAGYYADYDREQRAPSDQATAAALYPLFVGAASPARARATAAMVRARLLRPGGLATTTVDSGQQWDAPNAWAPLQWIAVSGLRRYGEPALAREIAGNFLGQVRALFAREHKLVEKYDAEASGQGGGGGEYPLQDGFGWTNGVTRALLALYPQEQDAPR